ncbi:MAG TPA: glycerate kinase [Candidatus Binatia bacterium]|nr:glycerate kinase [Candidatus Binatia bacterium]
MREPPQRARLKRSTCRWASKTAPRVVVAPDKFKGSLSAREVAAALAAGWSDVFAGEWETVCVPMADGGEGTVEAFLDGGARKVSAAVHGPLGETLEAQYALDGTTAIIESALASGLVLIPPERRDAMHASSFGTGELLRAALDAGAKRVVIGIGGSASSDGGAGLLQALGFALLDVNGKPLGPGGAALAGLASLSSESADPRLTSLTIDVASDVDNPLTGPAGASAVFGPQKGARPSDVAALDAALDHFADVVARATGRDLRDSPGAGAAGGMGFALIALLGASIRPGVELIAELRGLSNALEGAALCLTGEGRIDEQTLHGKTVDGVARLARARDVPVLAFGGSVDSAVEPELFRRGVACLPIADAPLSLAESMAQSGMLLRAASARAARCWRAASRVTGPGP